MGNQGLSPQITSQFLKYTARINPLMTATHLSTTTSRRDIITNSNKIPSPSSPQINYSDETLANLNITAGTLKDLEADIAEDAANLLTLQQAITKSEQLAFRLTRILHDYETRIGEVERIVMPVYRNILNMSQMNDRIEGTMSLVEHLMKINEQVRKEVIILLPGPEIDSLLVYLDSISRLEAILLDLAHSDLSHCKISLERAAATVTDARQKLQAAFRSWLTDESTATADLTVALLTVVKFSLNSSAHFSSLISDWIEIRSNYLAASCEPLFVQSQSFEKDPSGYQPGSHPLPAAFAQARSLLQSEEVFMASVWPTTAVGPTFLRSAQIVRDLAVTTVESITSKMKKALSRREYADQVYLFTVLGACYTAVHVEGSGDSLAIQVLLPSLKYFITTTATLLTDLIGEIRGTIPRALERPFAVAQNATVYELTSITVNVLKRIEKDDLVIDAILAGQSTNNWDGTLGSFELCDYSNIKRYFNDIMGSLESSIDAKSKTLRKPMQTLIFQLNNYNYLEKGLGHIKSELIDSSVLKRYEQIIEALKRSFFNSWQMISNLISSDSSKNISSSSAPISARSSQKDRLKAFTLEFDESVRIQQTCTIPDSELKTELIAKIRETILQPYILFYNQYKPQNQSLLTSSTSATSKYHDPDQIENMISHLFEG